MDRPAGYDDDTCYYAEPDGDWDGTEFEDFDEHCAAFPDDIGDPDWAQEWEPIENNNLDVEYI
jgi:hypothetical protein